MTPADAHSLRITRILPARREEVWRAITDPEELPRWWGPKGFTSPGIDFEPRIGESYRIAMQPPEGELFHLHGEFREVNPPGRLSYTFVWDPPDQDDRETLATLVLEESGDRTEVSLTQGEFATPARLELHRDGWTDAFERLEELLSRGGPSGQ
jgi:uncharacterized protein YndB with AHSA1/START domain